MSLRIQDQELYCYLHGIVLRGLLSIDAVLYALMVELEVPGKPAQLKRLSAADKLSLLEQHATHLQKLPSSLWFGVSLPELLAASLWRSNLSKRDVNAVFSSTKREADLAAPIVEWLKEKELTPYAEIPTGTKRPDLVGYKPAGWFSKPYITAIELKNDVSQLKRGLDQMTTFGEYAKQVYLACTPAMAADYLNTHASARNVKHWDADLLNRKLREFGFGLLLVLGTDVHEVIAPRERGVSANKLSEVVDTLAHRTALC